MGVRLERIGLKAGLLSQWLFEDLRPNYEGPLNRKTPASGGPRLGSSATGPRVIVVNNGITMPTGISVTIGKLFYMVPA